MTELNSAWRGRDRTTDVLAFAQREGPGPAPDENLLGDVVICIDQARRQAAENRVPLERELAMLLVHGVLHLLGYEHEGVDAATRRRMFRRQSRLLERLWEDAGARSRRGE